MYNTKAGKTFMINLKTVVMQVFLRELSQTKLTEAIRSLAVLVS